ncbi:MAG: trehalose-phosphatase [Candidatus Omnitrophica bacterium]|nr:trehalose-phosphatase [Candidatus Omnitrophota bacterium]
MRYFFEYWNKLKGGFAKKSVVLFLDYDGTLTPIVKTPHRAVLSSELKRLLERLIKNHLCEIAIISGRALKDIKKKIGISGIVYVGNHGLEIEVPRLKFSRPPFDMRRNHHIALKNPVSLRYKRIIEHIKDGLTLKLSTIKGAFVEDKGLSLSVHYRLVDKSQLPTVTNILQEAAILYSGRNKIKIKRGKKVFEIRPAVEWDKGKIVLWLLDRWDFSLKDKEILPVYLGDDITDEDAFKVLRNKGITIFVGEPKKSNARYYLKDTQEVRDFLNHIARLQKIPLKNGRFNKSQRAV